MAPETCGKRKLDIFEAAKMVRKAAKQNGVSLAYALRAAEKARKEIYDEWFEKE